MTPPYSHCHSYSLDSHSKSTDLATKFLSSTTPSQISSSISAVESHLSCHSSDQNRHFFSLAFPSFLCKFFGFDVSPSTSPQNSPPPPSGWLYTVSASNDIELASNLFNLLSPNGTLLTSIFAVDRLSLVKFVFPLERLPHWIKFLLSNQKDSRILSSLSPLLKSRVKPDEIKGNFQLHLNVFEYYIFWFAYYPLSRGDTSLNGNTSSKTRKSKLENWTSSISAISSSSKRGSEVKSECNLYLKLLYSYLRAFVPMNELSVHHQQPYRSSLLHYSSSFDDSVVLRAEFLVETFVHYWLVDTDFSPLAVNVCKAFGLSFPLKTVLSETPPSLGLGEVVRLLVKYLNLSSQAAVSDGGKSFGSSEVRAREGAYVSPSLPCGGSWNSYVQRPLYRFILRTFIKCPMGSSMKNVSDVVSVWIEYIEPWKLSEEEFVEFDAIGDASKRRLDKDGSDFNRGLYSKTWQGYVLSNYLFYTSLVMHFIGFAHKFLHTNPEVIVQMVARVCLDVNLLL